MSVNPEPWVNTHVIDGYRLLVEAGYAYSPSERSRHQRMVSDKRMREVYASEYLNNRLKPEGWRVWFTLACGCADVAARPGDGGSSLLKQERDRLEEYQKKMALLEESLGTVVSLMRDIDEIGFAARDIPDGLISLVRLIKEAGASALNRGESFNQLDFDSRVLPKLDAIQRDGQKLMPSTLQILTTLWEQVSLAADPNLTQGFGVSIASDPGVHAALNSRQHSPTAEFIRLFDMRMRQHECDVGPDFCMPPETMAILTAVALNLEKVDKKSVVSARSKK